MSPWCFRPFTAVVLALTGVTAAVAVPVDDLPEAVSDCLMCHADPDLALELGDGETLPLLVDAEVWAGSIHAGQLVCTDCHAGYDDDHPMGREIADRRSYELASTGACTSCHFDTYTRSQDSVHATLLDEGITLAPVCTDCHGAHDVHDPRLKQAMISRSCGSCHESVFDTYRESVHGKALVADHNRDVPACPDCHTSHTIEDPATVRFRLGSPAICVNCHGDETLMGRYGIPTDVADTYLKDFHGVTASLSARGTRDPRQVVVTCADCHGAHDTASPAQVGEVAMKRKVSETCASCHEGAAVDFPAAWLSHYRPSLSHAPLVFLVDLFYVLFIPFMVVGLGLQVVLHLYRLATGR